MSTLRTTYATIERLIAGDVEALSLWTEATKGRQGERTDLVDNVNEVERPPPRPTGNSREAALRRLNEAGTDERAAEARRAVLVRGSPQKGEKGIRAVDTLDSIEGAGQTGPLRQLVDPDAVGIADAPRQAVDPGALDSVEGRRDPQRWLGSRGTESVPLTTPPSST